MVLGDEVFTTLPKDFMMELENSDNIDIVYKRTEHELVNDINSARVLLVPSRGYESLPTVIMEAIACEVPVVATNAWGNPEVIKNQNLLFAEDAFHDFARAYDYALKFGYQENDYSGKILNVEHNRFVTAYKELQK